MKVLKYFIRDFYLWELNYEISVINSKMKARVQYEIELISALFPPRHRPLRAGNIQAGGRVWSSVRVDEWLKG